MIERKITKHELERLIKTHTVKVFVNDPLKAKDSSKIEKMLKQMKHPIVILIDG